MSDESNVQLSLEQRGRLRKAITSHSAWKAKREEFGWNIERMGVTALQECARVLGINIREVINAEAAQGSASSQAVENQAFTASETVVEKPVVKSKPADKMAALTDMLRELMAGDAVSPETIAKIVDERIQKAFEGIPSIKIELTRHDGTTHSVEGHVHPLFRELLVACKARRVNNRPLNVWIAGPAGSGKTHAAQEVAKALGLDFYFHSSVDADYKLMGFIDAQGKYHRTHFRDAFEHGGVILLDEVDGYDSNATLCLNAPLENGVCSFPDAIVERHPDCIIIGAANTWGAGANADYVGRNKLDGAFRDRFHVRFAWDYDVALELAVSGNEKWTRRVQAARERARAAQVKVLITPRASQAGAALLAEGIAEDRVAELTYLADLTKEQRKIVEGL